MGFKIIKIALSNSKLFWVLFEEIKAIQFEIAVEIYMYVHSSRGSGFFGEGK